MNLDWDAASGSWMVVGQYKLDNGDGYGDYSDIVQRIYALEKGGDGGVRLAGHPHSALDSEPNFLMRQLVAAAGSTEFGNFFSKGHVCHNEGEDGGFELTLARRYLTPKDARQSLARHARAGWGIGDDVCVGLLAKYYLTCCSETSCFPGGGAGGGAAAAVSDGEGVRTCVCSASASHLYDTLPLLLPADPRKSTEYKTKTKTKTKTGADKRAAAAEDSDTGHAGHGDGGGKRPRASADTEDAQA
jgi:hypothetical protein